MPDSAARPAAPKAAAKRTTAPKVAGKPAPKRSEPPAPPPPGGRRPIPVRIVIFAVVVLTALAGATGYVLHQASDRRQAEQAAARADAATPRLNPAQVLAVPHLVVRNTALGPNYGRLALVPRSNPGGPRAITDTSCDRVYSNAAGGICLSADRGAITTYDGHVLDPALRPTTAVKVVGSPSRARMSPDGRYVASTVFVAGHSYADVGFSTVTEIVEAGSGHGLGNLETWKIFKDGRRYKNVDVNFWGVTFGTDGNTFYATVGTKGTTYLVRGDIAGRQLTTLHENVECPSLSPDGKVIVYKKASGSASGRHWRFTALDLATGAETPLPETRSVDDQVAWLDNSHVLYAVPRGSVGSGRTDVWESPVPPLATGAPTLVIADAESPASVPG
jgi:hypothetical protein